MLQAHSPLWHYLWVAPNVCLFLLAIVVWKRRLHRRIPAFFALCLIGAAGELVLYVADIVPSVQPELFWRIDWAALLVEGLLKFLVISEIFAQVFGQYPSIAHTGKALIRTVAVMVVLLATFMAAYAPRDGIFAVVSGANFLEQAIYLIECGLLIFISLMSAYFHLSWDRITLGITLGLGISACVHLGVWAVLVNTGLPDSARNGLIFLKMATYHFCVLLWLYYVLTKGKAPLRSVIPVPENHLALWNRELERLLQ